MMFTFSVFDHRYLSWANLVRKFKIVCSKLNLIQRLIRICKIQRWCLFICFRLKIAALFGKFGPKNRNCQFKLKIGTQTNSNMKNSIVIFLFSTGSILFLEICSKNQNCLLKLKFRIQINLNMQNSMVIFIFLVRKYPFCVNLIQKFKRVILR